MADVISSQSPELNFGHFGADVELDSMEADVLSKMETLMANSPAFAKASLEMFLKDPETTSALLDFIRENPDGIGALNTWRQVIHNKLDYYIDPSEVVSKKIEKDPYITSEKKHAKADDPKSELKIRRRKLLILIEAHGNDA